MFELFGLNDCAAEVVLFHKDTILAKENPQKLLDLLTTELAGDRQSYQEYVGLYEQDISAFMPAEGYRYPDHTAPTFDKVLVRRASGRPAFAALNLGKAKFSRLKRLIEKLKGP